MKTPRQHKLRKQRTVMPLAELLEDKVCLTASVAFADGHLLVSGEADGPISISVNIRSLSKCFGELVCAIIKAILSIHFLLFRARFFSNKTLFI